MGGQGMDSGVERLRALIREKSFRARGDFTLASGKPSGFFFDMKPTMLDPEGSTLLAEAFLERIADEEADHIGGVAVGAVALVAAICTRSRDSRRPRKAFFVRKEVKGHGMGKQIEGCPPAKGAEALLFEDVTTTGGSAMAAVDALREAGCEVRTVYTIVDRLEGAQARFASEGIRLVPLFTREDFTAAA